jgi:hypothetical protein
MWIRAAPLLKMPQAAELHLFTAETAKIERYRKMPYQSEGISHGY